MNQTFTFSRRQLFGGLALSGLSGGLLSALNAEKKSIPGRIRLQKGMTILFQGDSITDAGRQNRKSPKVNDQKSMGLSLIHI